MPSAETVTHMAGVEFLATLNEVRRVRISSLSINDNAGEISTTQDVEAGQWHEFFWATW